ncbi:6007_t:CDS:2, partial [Funneliformis mosseae]
MSSKHSRLKGRKLKIASLPENVQDKSYKSKTNSWRMNDTGCCIYEDSDFFRLDIQAIYPQE